MQLGYVTQSASGGWSQAWLGSAHGTEATATITLKGSTLSSLAAGGVVPSGLPVKALSGADEGLYGPVTDAGDKLAGFVLVAQDFDGTRDVIAPLLTRGKVKAHRLPEDAFDVTELEVIPALFEVLGENGVAVEGVGVEEGGA